MSGKRHELGDVWTCECGKKHGLYHSYLVAHWNEKLFHTCGCGRQHTVQAGMVRLVKAKKSRPAAHERNV